MDNVTPPAGVGIFGIAAGGFTAFSLVSLTSRFLASPHPANQTAMQQIIIPAINFLISIYTSCKQNP
jgi:hypothetical protein